MKLKCTLSGVGAAALLGLSGTTYGQVPLAWTATGGPYPGGPLVNTPGTPILPPTDQNVTRADLTQTASALQGVNALSAYQYLTTLRNEASNALPDLQTRVNTATADLARAREIRPNEDGLEGRPEHPDVRSARLDLQYAQNRYNAYNDVVTAVNQIENIHNAKVTDQTAAIAGFSGLVDRYNGGVKSDANIEGIINSLYSAPSSPNAGFQAQEVVAAQNAVNNLQLLITGNTGLVEQGIDPNNGGLNPIYRTRFNEAVQQVTEAYVGNNNPDPALAKIGFQVGLSDLAKDRALKDMGNASWERRAILDTYSTISDGTQAINVGTATSVIANTGTLNAQTANAGTVNAQNLNAANATIGNLNVNNGANINGGLVVNGGAALNGAVTINGVNAATINDVNSERDRAIGAENALGVRIDSETTRATAAENALGVRITDETNRAIGAENALGVRIDNETTRATTAENALGVRIDTETARATAAEGVLRTDLNTEVTRATAAEAGLRTDLNAEVTRATAAETLLGAQISDETIRATAAEVSLSNAIRAENARAVASETLINDRIAAEEIRAQRAESAVLQSANRYTDDKFARAQRGIAMAAALQSPHIEHGDNNAVKLSVAGIQGNAGFSFGYARRITKGLSVDIAAATEDEFKDGAVRGGINYSW